MTSEGERVSPMTSPDAEATVAMLREALERSALRWVRNEGHRCKECDGRYSDNSLHHQPDCLIGRALTDSSSMAQAYRERIEQPWREALARLSAAHSMDSSAIGFACNCGPHSKARHLLDTPEGSKP